MEEELLNLIQVKLEQDGEDENDYSEQDQNAFLLTDDIQENLNEKLLTYQENLLQLLILSIICWLTNLIVFTLLRKKQMNLNQIFGFSANSTIVQNIMLFIFSFNVFIALQYASSLLEAIPFTGIYLAKYIILFIYVYVCYIFYRRMEQDFVFLLSQIKKQKNISFMIVFLSDQLLTISPIILKTIYILNYILRVNIKAVNYTVYFLVMSKFVRSYQCIRLYMADPNKKQDIFTNTEIQNCIKYLVSIMCLILDQFLVYKWSIDYGLLISHVCYSIYTFYWDVYEDWGLNITSAKYFSSQEFIKRQPLFSKYTYIFAMLFNASVRLNWAVKYLLNSSIYHEVDFYMYCFEISRRSLWNLLKLEQEQYLLKKISEKKNKISEIVELTVVSPSIKITIEESSPIKLNKFEDHIKRNN